MVRRIRLIFWRWVTRLHDRLHQASIYADTITGESFTYTGKAATTMTVTTPNETGLG